jgi:hypothetical protein
VALHFGQGAVYRGDTGDQDDSLDTGPAGSQASPLVLVEDLLRLCANQELSGRVDGDIEVCLDPGIVGRFDGRCRMDNRIDSGDSFVESPCLSLIQR